MADNLPFQSPGKTLLGESRAQDLLPEAKRQMYLVKLFAETAGIQTYRRYTTFADGSRIIASTQAGIERVLIDAAPHPVEEEEEESSQKMNRLVWLPEGFVLTPKSVASPNGFGMPPTEDGLGTPGGPLKQVIVNRFVNNQYPDSVCEGIVGPQNPSVRTFCVAPLFFMDWEINDRNFGIGVWDGAEFLPQFSARWVPKYREPETGTWYCHRPMYALDAERLVHKTIREETNMVRAVDSLAPVGLPVRGSENGLAETITFLMGDSKVLGHGSIKYRAGYRDFEDFRFPARFGMAGTTSPLLPSSTAGENLYLQGNTATVTQQRLGEDAVQWWRNSSEHYANMIRDWRLSGAHYGCIESASAQELSGIIEAQDPPYDGTEPSDPYPSPVQGYTATQIFHGMQNFVTPSQVGQEGDNALGLASPFFTQGHGYFPRVAMNYLATGAVLVHFKGRSIEVFKNNATNGVFSVTAAKMVVSGGTVTKMRVAGHWRATAAATNHYVRIYEGDAHDFAATRILIGAYLLPSDIGQMSIPKFSASGSLMVFSYTRAVSESSVVGLGVTVSQDLQDGTSTTATSNNDRVWGETLHFFEFAGGAFNEITTAQSLDVTVSRWVTGIHQACIGEYKVFADYSGETVVYATAVIDSETDQSGVGTYTETVRLRGSLRFPDFSTIEYTHTDTGAGLEVSGFFRHFLYLDIMRPERTVYMQYDVSGTNIHTFRMAIYGDGQLIRDKDNAGKPNADPLFARSTAGFSVSLPGMGVCRLQPFEAINTVGSDVIRANPSSKFPAAAVTHKAALVTTMSFTGDVQFLGSLAYPNSDNVGPSVIMGAPVSYGLDGVTDFSAAFYKGECLYAGYVGNTIRANMASGDTGWTGEGRYFWYSSLPMRAIVGMPAVSMHDNILPIGTL